MRQREPIFNAPGVVVAILAVFGLVHAGRAALSEEDGIGVVLALAFIPARLSGYVGGLPGGEWARYGSLLSHQLLHGDLTHLLINGAWLLVFGSIVARRIGAARLVGFALACGVAGGLAFWALHPALLAPLVGASGGISGLMGATFRFLFVLRPGGAGPESVPLMAIPAALTDRRVLGAILAYVAINIVLAVFTGLFAEPGTIAWEAHLGGFALGFLTFGLVDPPRPSDAYDFQSGH